MCKPNSFSVLNGGKALKIIAVVILLKWYSISLGVMFNLDIGDHGSSQISVFHRISRSLGITRHFLPFGFV